MTTSLRSHCDLINFNCHARSNWINKFHNLCVFIVFVANMPSSKRRSQGPGQAIFKSRTLHLPYLMVTRTSDIWALEDHIDELVYQLPRLAFSIRSFAVDSIAKQYIVLKYDLYYDALNHLHGMFNTLEHGGGKGEEKLRDYWLMIHFIGYQFRWVKVLLTDISDE